jgi:hypothetical protein
MTGRCYQGDRTWAARVLLGKAPQVTLSREREGEGVALGKASIVQGWDYALESSEYE